MGLLKDIVLAAPIVGLGAWLGKLLHKESESVKQVPAPEQSQQVGTEVYAPWIQSGQPSMSFGGVSGGTVPSGPSVPGTIQIQQPVRVREDRFSEIVTIDGTAGDDYSTNDYEFNQVWQRFDIITEGGDIVVQLKRVNNAWTNDIVIPEGSASVDFAFMGIRIKSRVSGQSVKYYINLYRW